MESLNVKNINDEKIFNVIDPNGQGEVVNRIRPISISINQKAETINDQTDSTINLAVYWNDTWKSILDLTFDESLRQEYGKLTQDLTNIQKDIDMKQYKDAETKTADFLKYVANLSSKYTAIPEKAVVSKIKNDFVKIKADRNSVKVAISDKLLNFMLKKYAKVNNLDYTKSNECFSTSKFNCLANNYDIYYHSPEIFQKQAYMTVVKDNKVVGSYKVNYDQFSKFASKFMLTPQKLGYSKDRLAGYMKTAEVVMQNIFFDSVDEAKEWQEMVDEKKKEQATTPEGEEETTETTTTETKTEIGEGKSESPVKGDGGLARPSEDFASDEIPESEPRQQEQQGGGQNLGASKRVNLLKKKAGVRQTQKINNTINDIKQYYNELNQKSKEELMKIVMETYYKDLYNDVGEKDKKILEKKFLENENEEIWKQRLIKDKYTYDKGYDFAFENWGPDEQNINEEILALLNRKMIPEEFYKGVQQGLRDGSLNDVLLRKERNEKRRQKYHETKEKWKNIGKMYGESSNEKNLAKTAKVGYNAEPENELEEKAVKIGDEIMNVEWDLGEEIQNLEDILEENPKNKKVIEKRISVLKGKRIEAIKKVVEKYNKEFANKEIADLVYEHLQDNNAHKANSIVLNILNGKQASKKVKLNKKAGIDMNLSYGHFLKEEDENKLPKFNTLEDIKTYIKTNNKFPGNFFYKGGLFTEDEYDMDGMVVTYSSPEIDKSIIINTPDNRYNYKGNYKNLDMDIVEEDAPYFRTDVNYTLPKKVYEELFPKKNSNKNLNLNKKAGVDITVSTGNVYTLLGMLGKYCLIQPKVIDGKNSNKPSFKLECKPEEVKEVIEKWKDPGYMYEKANKGKKLEKQALYGDVQEQDIVPAKTETKVYLQSEDKESKTEKCFICEKEFPIKDMKKEKSVGYMCNDCIDKMKANGYGLDIESLKKAKKNKVVSKQAEEQTIEEKIEEAETSDIVKGTIGVGDIVTICIDKLEYPEESFKYTELIGQPLILMENDKEDINKVIVEQTEYPFQRMTVNKDDIIQYAELKGADVVVEDTDGDEMITTFEELPIVAKQCKIKSIHKAATKKKANLTKKAINSLEDVAGLIDDILSDYDWYDYADQLEVGEKSHYENILADLQKDEKGTIEALFNRVSEDDEEYSSSKLEELKTYYNAKFGGK